MPPATISLASPHLIDCAAIITALSPLPQTLLTVTAGTRVGDAAAERRLAGRVLSQAGADDVARGGISREVSLL